MPMLCRKHFEFTQRSTQLVLISHIEYIRAPALPSVLFQNLSVTRPSADGKAGARIW